MEGAAYSLVRVSRFTHMQHALPHLSKLNASLADKYRSLSTIIYTILKILKTHNLELSLVIADLCTCNLEYCTCTWYVHYNYST